MKWGVNETKFLLNLVPLLSPQVGPLKKFRMKKPMWEYIAIKIMEKFGLQVCGRQVETRYRCIFKRTKKSIDNNSTSGSSREDPEYEHEIRRIVGMDDSICPEFLIGPGRRSTKEDIFPSHTVPSTSPSTTSLQEEAEQTGAFGSATTSLCSPSPSPSSSTSSVIAESTQPRRKTPSQRFFQKFMEAKNLTC